MNTDDLKYSYTDKVDFSILQNLTIKRIIHVKDTSLNDKLIFVTNDLNLSKDVVYVMTHDQDCCESVCLEEIVGDLDDLVGTPVIIAEVVTDSNTTPYSGKSNSYTDRNGKECSYEDESYTWTFYKISTVRGSVTLRWYGSSNGYYSESVDLYKATLKDIL